MALYSRVTYWDQRYRKNVLPYEWYQGYQSLRNLLNPIGFAAQQNRADHHHHLGAEVGTVPGSSVGGAGHGASAAATASATATGSTFPPREECRVLILGCGNSTFGEDLQRDGWTGRIVNLDFSSVVIEQMKAKYCPAWYQDTDIRPMEWVHADLTQGLPFDDASFDLVICKASFDAILCGPGSRADTFRSVRECVRVLAPSHGIYFLVTHGNPDSRIEYLEHDFDLYHFWSSVTVHTVPRTPQYPVLQHHHHHHHSQAPRSDYVYICRKRPMEYLGGGLENNATMVVRTDHSPHLPSSSGALTVSGKAHQHHHHHHPPGGGGVVVGGGSLPVTTITTTPSH